MKKNFLVTVGVLFLTAMLMVLPRASAQDDDDGKILYLAKANLAPVRLKILRDTPLNLTQASNTYMTYLPRGQIVEVLAIARYQLQVRGRMSTGAVQGWVNRGDVATIPDEAVSDLRKKIKSQKEMDDAVKRKEVIFGMSQEQVRMILGKPSDKSRTQDEDEITEVWTYYSYKSVPIMQTFGYGTNAYTQVVTQKIRTGSQSISFRDGVVVRIEQKSDQGVAPEPIGYPYPPMTPIVIPKGAY